MRIYWPGVGCGNTNHHPVNFAFTSIFELWSYRSYKTLLISNVSHTQNPILLLAKKLPRQLLLEIFASTPGYVMGSDAREAAKDPEMTVHHLTYMSRYMHIHKDPSGILEIFRTPGVRPDQICLRLVLFNPSYLEYLQENTPEILFLALEGGTCALRYISKQTPEICLYAVQKNVDNLRYVKTQTDDICLAAVRKDGHSLRRVREQTEEVCLAAIEENYRALDYVKSQTPKLCWVALHISVDSISYIREQTYDMCLFVIQKNPIYATCSLIKKQTPELCLAAVKREPLTLLSIKHQTYEVCLAAVKRSRETAKYIRDPDIRNRILQELT